MGTVPIVPRSCAFFEHAIEVRASDMDSAGHLNHVAMIALFEHARMRAHRDVRDGRPDLPDMNTVVRRLTVDYLGQAPLFESLRVRSWIGRDGRTSRTWEQVLLRPDAAVVAAARVVSVLVDPATGRPVELPPVYRDAFAAFREAPEFGNPGTGTVVLDGGHQQPTKETVP